MIDRLFDSSTIPLLLKMAAFTERRHDVLAGNLANVSTPDYRTRDLPVAQFRTALEEAVGRHRPADSRGQVAWSFTAGQSSDAGDPFPPTLFRALDSSRGAITFQDGNNRKIEEEIMEITKNSLMQTLAVEVMNAQFSRLQAVISERA